MRAIQWLCFITLFAVMFCFAVLTANGQALRGDVLGLRPTSMPATCNTGDLRIDSADAYRLKVCEGNVWQTTTANDNVMTALGDIIVGGASGVQTRLGIGTLSHVLQVSPSGVPAYGFITNGNVDASAGIVDTKLATIATAGKVSNSATTATDANTNSAIVARDGSGNFSAGVITASLTGAVTGNADTATALAANPADCSAGQFANAIGASGALTCAAVGTGTLSGTLAVANGGTGVGTTSAALNVFLPSQTSASGKVLKSDGTNADWALVSGGTNDQREYILNGKAEADAVGWATYADAAGTSPVDGTSGTSTGVTFTRTTTGGEILRETASFKLAKDASNRQGMGASYDFTVDPKDYGSLSPVYISLDYTTTANYISGDVKIFVYDKDAGAVIGVFDGNQLSGALPAGTNARLTGLFYPTTATSNDYRLIFHIAGTTATAWDFLVDSVHAGNIVSAPGAIITNWAAYTPTFGGFGTVSSVATYSRRVGDSLEVRGGFTAGTVAASTANMTLGYNGVDGNVTIDTAKTSISKQIFGRMSCDQNSTTVFDWVVAVNGAGGNTVLFGVQNSTTPAINLAVNGDTVTGTGNRCSFFYTVPITGWQATAAMGGAELTQQTASASYTSTAGNSIANGSVVIVDFATAANDPLGLVTTGGSWKYTAQGTSCVTVKAGVTYASASFLAGNILSLYLYKNGSIVKRIAGKQIDANITGRQFVSGSGDTCLAPGDYIDVRAEHGESAARSLTTTAGDNFIDVTSQPSFSVFSTLSGVPTQYDRTASVSGTDSWSTARAVAIPYQTADGAWRMRFNVVGTKSSDSSVTLTWAGVTFKSGQRQSINCNDDSGGSAPSNCFVSAAGNGEMQLSFAAAFTASNASGDVELASKPTFVP